MPWRGAWRRTPRCLTVPRYDCRPDCLAIARTRMVRPPARRPVPGAFRGFRDVEWHPGQTPGGGVPCDVLLEGAAREWATVADLLQRHGLTSTMQCQVVLVHCIQCIHTGKKPEKIRCCCRQDTAGRMRQGRATCLTCPSPAELSRSASQFPSASVAALLPPSSAISPFPVIKPATTRHPATPTQRLPHVKHHLQQPRPLLLGPLWPLPL